MFYNLFSTNAYKVVRCIESVLYTYQVTTARYQLSHTQLHMHIGTHTCIHTRTQQKAYFRAHLFAFVFPRRHI